MSEELNTKLYEKLFAEQEQFKGWLLTQPPEEILNHAYEYTIREDIVLAMEHYDVSDEQAKHYWCYLHHWLIFLRTLRRLKASTWTRFARALKVVPINHL